MKAYVELVQRREREIGCDVLTHQKWCVPSLCGSWAERVAGAARIISTAFSRVSGMNRLGPFADADVAVSSGSSSTSAVGKDSTEHSF